MIPFPFQAAGEGLIQQAALASLTSLIAADSPVYYFRHNEPSGSTMVNSGSSVGASSTYLTASSGPTLATAALYPGGPTCVNMATNAYGALAASPLPTLNELTLLTICRFPAVTGQRALICADNNSGTGRRWQFRLNGTAVEFVKIPTSVEVKSYGTIASNTTYMIAVTVTSAGVVTIYINNVASSTSTFGVINYGGFNTGVEVSRCAGAGGIYSNGMFSESCVFATALSAGRLGQYWAASGL